MMNKTFKVLLLASMMPFAASAADELSPWYVGAGLGVNNYEPNCDQKTMKTCGEDDPYAWDVFAGYLFNDYFGVELGYRDLGRAEWTDYSNKLNDVGVKGATLGLVAFWPFADKWSLSAEAGAMNYHISNNKQWGSEYYSDSGVAPYFGAGIGYNITENLKLAAKYRRYENLDEEKWNTLEMESNYWGLELSYRFGSTSKPAPVVAPVVVEPVDSDNDGVNDDMDQCPNTPANHKVDANGCSIYVEKLETLEVKAEFDNNSSVLKADSMAEIQKVADFMSKYPKADLEIAGHASLPGKADYNQWLSQKRADAVAKVLVEQYGIDASRISAKGYGESQPLMQGSSAEANKVNRRIEALLSFKEKEALLK
ncbi:MULTISPECIES: OmpA family protein [Shewanella]|uniref:OmpA family protein n=2 Tax=Shewanella chilikensis TaxID=558541 RepID=A0A6G7LUM1_9GAMM|nr:MULTISPECIES: OmpA family protein [Shewanella]MCA0949378.1 outer membrane beta-barrel protein [Shewanella chilikensis]MCE9850607.1 outer membrane beta-barrel protein [Shewanella chilikensis]MCL1152887.1 outer membrane beta-barrel protein [Shewanella chilikensis]MCL1161897.1 outer membrane beta-barrel protein [Shewanella chilikensis]QIJ05487.1 OmpA family protein [Shewanella chilikensis]